MKTALYVLDIDLGRGACCASATAKPSTDAEHRVPARQVCGSNAAGGFSGEAAMRYRSATENENSRPEDQVL